MLLLLRLLRSGSEWSLQLVAVAVAVETLRRTWLYTSARKLLVLLRKLNRADHWLELEPTATLVTVPVVVVRLLLLMQFGQLRWMAKDIQIVELAELLPTLVPLVCSHFIVFVTLAGIKHIRWLKIVIFIAKILVDITWNDAMLGQRRRRRRRRRRRMLLYLMSSRRDASALLTT